MKTKIFNNNLRLVVNTNKNVDVVSFKIYVCVGAKDEEQDEYGYAHFLEHMFFKSTNKLKTEEVLKKLDELGATKNAYTSILNTCYYFKCLSSDLYKCAELYSDMFFDSKLDQKEVEKEKLVILEEYKMGEDDPFRKSINDAYNSLFSNTSFGHSIIGTVASIKSVTSKKLKAFKDRLYKPENIVISISGNVTYKKAIEIVNKFFVSRFKYNDPKPIFELPKYINLNPKSKISFSKKDNKQSTIFILFDLKEQDQRKRKAFRLLFSILGMGMSSKFFEIIRGQKGLVYSIESSSEKIANNYIGEILFSTSNSKVGDALIEIRRIINNCANGKIYKDELDRAKNKIISAFEYARESNSNIAENNAIDLIEYGKILKDSEIIKEYKSITLNEVIDCAKELSITKSYVVSSVGNHEKSLLNLF